MFFIYFFKGNEENIIQKHIYMNISIWMNQSVSSVYGYSDVLDCCCPWAPSELGTGYTFSGAPIFE